MLHDYACLYFNARNPMLYLRRGQHEALCVLSIEPAVLDLPGVVITDQNAAGKWARFAAAPEGVSIVNRNMTFAEWWTHPEDQIEEWRHKAAMCAEVLVPDRVLPSFVRGAYVSGTTAEQRIGALGTGIKTVINARLFFR
jgi:ssDNA thymidine ADP-ribosyltransferase, DarT